MTLTYRGKDKLKGLMPVLPTPLLADETPDEAGMERLVEFLLNFPFCGFWAVATAGEDENFPVEVRKDVTRLLVKYAGGKVPLLVKASEPGTKETIQRVREFADLGIDIAVVHPQHKGLSQDHYLRALETIADSSPLPIYIYHNYDRGGHLTIDTITRLSNHPKIAGMKAGGYNLAELQRLALFCNPDFSVFTAGAGQLLACLAMGVSGHMAIPLAAFPEISFAVFDAFQKGNIHAAQNHQRELIEWISSLPKLQNREVNGETKAVLEARGIIHRHVSAPFIPASDEQIEQIKDRMAEHPFAV